MSGHVPIIEAHSPQIRVEMSKSIWLLITLAMTSNATATITEPLTSIEQLRIERLASQSEQACVDAMSSRDSGDLPPGIAQEFTNKYCGCIRTRVSAGVTGMARQGIDSAGQESILSAAKDCAAAEFKKIFPDLCKAVIKGLPPGPLGKPTADTIANSCGCAQRVLDNVTDAQFSEVARQTIQEYEAYKRHQGYQPKQPLSLMGAFMGCAGQPAQGLTADVKLLGPLDEKSKSALQLTLAKEAVRLGSRKLGLKTAALEFKNRGAAVPAEVAYELDRIDVRLKEIADKQFAMSGVLQIDASQPGEFGSYIAECLNRINRGLRAESAESRRPFLGKTAVVRLDLTANGAIESVVPNAQKQDKEFGNYLHDLIWKVPSFPAVPQLKDRNIERVSISMKFTLSGVRP